jgi:hypothetical protein
VMVPSTSPLVWPSLPLLPLVGIVVAAAPAWITPPVPQPTARDVASDPEFDSALVGVAA